MQTTLITLISEAIMLNTHQSLIKLIMLFVVALEGALRGWSNRSHGASAMVALTLHVPCRGICHGDSCKTFRGYEHF